MNKPTAKHYGIIGSDSVIRAYPADETDEYIVHLEQRAEAAGAKFVPDGWKLVPVELSWEMISAAIKHHEGDAFLPVSLYKTMLAAAPTPHE